MNIYDILIWEILYTSLLCVLLYLFLIVCVLAVGLLFIVFQINNINLYKNSKKVTSTRQATNNTL